MKRSFLIIFLVLVTASCSSPAPSVPIDTQTATAIQPANTPLPTSTSLPTPSPTPEIPVRDGGTLHPSIAVISKDNLSQLRELALWGKGVVKNVEWSEDGKQIIVDTSLSRYIYDASSLQRVKEEEIQEIDPTISLVVDSFDFNTRGFNVVVYDGGQIMGSFQVEENFRGGWPNIRYLSESNIIAVDREAVVELRDGTSYEIFDDFEGVAYKYDVAADGSYSLITGYYSAMDVSKDRKTEAIGQFDGQIFLRSGDEFTNDLSLEAEGAVRFLSFSPDGTKLASESNGSILVWDVLTGAIIGYLPDTFISGDFFNEQYYRTDAGLGYISVQDNKIAFSNESIVNVVSLLSGEEIGTFTAPVPVHLPVHDVFFSSNGQHLISNLDYARYGGSPFHYDRVYVWDIANQKLIKSMDQETEMISSSVYSASDHLLLVGNAFSTRIRIWNTDDGSALPSIRAWEPNSNQFQADGTHSLTISPDGKFVFSWSALEGIANLWEIQTQQKVMAIKIPASEYSEYRPAFYPVAISLDSKKLMFTLFPEAHIAAVYSIPDGEELYRILEYSAVFSPDGSIIAASVGNNGIRFYDSETGNKLGDVTSKYANGLQLLYFSDDGKTLIAVSNNGTIGVWGIP